MAPPETATLADGTTIDLRPLATRITDAHMVRHPEDAERYGEALARQWCTHDNQHLLAWAAADLDLDGQLAWLARVLESRGYPVESLIDNVATGAEVVDRELPGAGGRTIAQRLRSAARALSESRD